VIEKRRAFALLLFDVYNQLADWIFAISRWNALASLLKKTRACNIIPKGCSHIEVIGTELILAHRENICSDVDYRLTCLINQAQSKVTIVLILVLLNFANTVVSSFDFHAVSISNNNKNAKILSKLKL
jgi:hypothetical protein